VQFSATEELVAKLEKATVLLSHRVPDGNVAAIFEEALAALIDKVQKDPFAVRAFSEAQADFMRKRTGKRSQSRTPRA
jgi:hypothetical protein